MARARQSRADILAGIETRRLETAAARIEAARLQQTGATATVEDEEYKAPDGKTRTRVIVRAWRGDVFKLLLERGALAQEHFDAVRAHEADTATAMGWNTPERHTEHIRASVEGAPGQNITQPMIDASARVQWVCDRLPARDRTLLAALLTENDANCGRWRGTVERHTGERHEAAQAAAVRAMCANLKDVRDKWREPRHKGT